MNPETKKVELLWRDVIEQTSMTQCQESGARYKYLLEDANNLDVQYFCVEK
jgi:hypothetical protein